MISTRDLIMKKMGRILYINHYPKSDREAMANGITIEIRQKLKEDYVVEHFKKQEMKFKNVYISNYRNLFFVYLTKGQPVTYNCDYFLDCYLNIEFNRLETIHNIIKYDEQNKPESI